MKKYALILGGGSGTRAGGDLPKQFRPLGGIPVIWHAVRAFHSENPSTQIVIVIHQEYMDLWHRMMADLPDTGEIADVKVISGGKSRLESVRKGLEYIASRNEAGEDSLVAVHDGARPFVTERMISEGWERAAGSGGAVPAVALTDSIRELMPDGGSRYRDRSRFVGVQTPQVFRFKPLLEAYRNADMEDKGLTDDASVVESQGGSVVLYRGDENNIKITTPRDFLIAEALLRGE